MIIGRHSSEASPDAPDYGIRLPRQQRSWDAWHRMLEAGLSLLSEGGYEAFTIAAICERAAVLPRAIYERVDTKDALFMAVYDVGMERIWAESHPPDEPGGPGTGTVRETVGTVVGRLARGFDRHQDFLRPILLLAPHHPEVYRRGRQLSEREAAAFVESLRATLGATPDPDPDADLDVRLRFAFDLAFSTIMFRTMYGPGFATPAIDHDQFVESLVDAVCGYLAAAGIDPPDG